MSKDVEVETDRRGDGKPCEWRRSSQRNAQRNTQRNYLRHATSLAVSPSLLKMKESLELIVVLGDLGGASDKEKKNSSSRNQKTDCSGKLRKENERDQIEENESSQCKADVENELLLSLDLVYSFLNSLRARRLVHRVSLADCLV